MEIVAFYPVYDMIGDLQEAIMSGDYFIVLVLPECGCPDCLAVH